MKTRTYVTKALIAIVNLDRYPTLPNDILTMLVCTNEDQDNNKINGLLMLLNRLWEKNDLFKFYKPDEFFTQVELLISNQFNQYKIIIFFSLDFNYFVKLKILLKSCAVNWMLILQLLLKSQHERVNSFKEICSRAFLKAIHSIYQPDGHSLSSGAHDLLAVIGEVFCVLNSSSKTDDILESRMLELTNSSREHSMHLMRGTVNFYRQNQALNSSYIDLSRILVGLFKEKAFKSVLEWKTIDNIHDLKWVPLK